MTSPTTKLIEEVLELDRHGLTPKPWHSFKWGDGSQERTGRSNVGCEEWGVTIAIDAPDSDASLIAHYRTSAPKLARIVKVYEEALKAYEHQDATYDNDIMTDGSVAKDAIAEAQKIIEGEK